MTEKYLQVRESDGRIEAVLELPAGQGAPRVQGHWRFLPCPLALPSDWRDCRLVDGEIVLAPRDHDLPAHRALAERRIDDHAQRAMEHIRPAAAARVDAERVRQAELALASADQYSDAFPLIGGTGSLHERARAVLAAAQATADQLARIDVARRDAKARIRAATTPAEIAAVTMEIPS